MEPPPLGNSVQPPMRANSPNDFQTPPHAIKPLLPYLPKEWTVWECAAGKGNLVRAFAADGRKVIASDILSGFDFLTCEPTTPYDVIITNPPFSLKDEFLTRAYALKKPFALLVPLTTFEGKVRQALFKQHGVQVMFLPKRLNFETPSGAGGEGAEKKSSSWFATAWFCWGLNLPKDINFSEI